MDGCDCISLRRGPLPEEANPVVSRPRAFAPAGLDGSVPLPLARARGAGGTINPVKTQDLVDFAMRPWGATADGDAEHWLLRKRELGPAEGIRMAEELRALVAAQRPDWPRPAEREADREVHARVSEALRSVRSTRTP